MTYYYSGLPYSDELYHHGILGQKWGIRRFQNEDGTLTPAGKVRYYGGKAASKVGRGIVTVGKGVGRGAVAIGKGVGKGVSEFAGGVNRGIKNQLGKRAPFMLNDKDLEDYYKRLELKIKYKDMLADSKAKKRRLKGESVVKSIVKDSAKTIANKAVNKFADEMLKSDEDRMKEKFSFQNEARLNSLRSTLVKDETKNRDDLNRRNNLISQNRTLDSKITEWNAKLLTTSPHDPNYLSLENNIKTARKIKAENGRDIEAINDVVKERQDSMKRIRDSINSMSSGKKN